jgi:hypothetical protein
MINRNDAIKISDLYQCIDGFDIEGFTDYIFSKFEAYTKEYDLINNSLHNLMVAAEKRGTDKAVVNSTEIIKKNKDYIGEFSISCLPSDQLAYDAIDLYIGLEDGNNYKIIVLKAK